MVKLLIIADDFTGALDTGVQFAVNGTPTLVVTDREIDFDSVNPEIRVLVLDAETRHLDAEQAYRIVYDAVARAGKAGVPYIYKKTDSALRGNIGAELAALYDLSENGRVHFVPAFPRMGRVTKDGVHYVDGIPVGESVFGKDPFEPVRASFIPEIISGQSGPPVRLIKKMIPGEKSSQKGVLVYDTETDEQMTEIAESLYGQKELGFCAGCAGFASVLPGILGLSGEPERLPLLSPRLLVACGSVNPITVTQLDRAEEAGVPRIRLNARQKLDPDWPEGAEASECICNWGALCVENSACILDSNDSPGDQGTEDYVKGYGISRRKARQSIAANIGGMVKRLLDGGLDATLLITGGDTLKGFLEQVGISKLRPICEVTPGAVLSGFTYKGKTYYVISKSGGFGKESLIEEVLRIVTANSKNTEKKREEIRCCQNTI